MGFFYPLATERPIAPGDPWQPESAARYNAVSELLNQINLSQNQSTEAIHANGLHLVGINTTDQEIPPDSPVEIIPTPPENSSTTISKWCLVQKISSTTSNWGITQQNIPSGSYGIIVLSGLVWSQISGTPQKYVTVEQGKLCYASMGRGQVLRTLSDGRALIWLREQSVVEYDGLLKVLMQTDEQGTTTLLMVNGAKPEESTAGYCYVNGDLHIVPRQSIAPQDGWLGISCNQLPVSRAKLAFENIIPDFPNSPRMVEAFFPIAYITALQEGGFQVNQVIRYTIPQLWIGGPCEETTETPAQ